MDSTQLAVAMLEYGKLMSQAKALEKDITAITEARNGADPFDGLPELE